MLFMLVSSSVLFHTVLLFKSFLLYTVVVMDYMFLRAMVVVNHLSTMNVSRPLDNIVMRYKVWPSPIIISN